MTMQPRRDHESFWNRLAENRDQTADVDGISEHALRRALRGDWLPPGWTLPGHLSKLRAGQSSR